VVLNRRQTVSVKWSASSSTVKPSVVTSTRTQNRRLVSVSSFFFALNFKFHFIHNQKLATCLISEKTPYTHTSSTHTHTNVRQHNMRFSCSSLDSYYPSSRTRRFTSSEVRSRQSRCVVSQKRAGASIRLYEKSLQHNCPKGGRTPPVVSKCILIGRVNSAARLGTGQR
jgi:hypothetical protein